jgi:hypothetical protein
MRASARQRKQQSPRAAERANSGESPAGPRGGWAVAGLQKVIAHPPQPIEMSSVFNAEIYGFGIAL